MMEKQKTKLGARVLSDLELNAILPNAESVYEQIETFRNSIPDVEEGQEELEQKTNNIGIMGCRGAGKTSILKTFYQNLKEKNAESEGEKKREKRKNGDIILPIIVPENMSSGTTLMDVVLGMLKPVVEERKKKPDTWSGDCIYSGRDPLEQQYNELVKQYCYIKKDYRNILIQQFTTEQNYVDKTKEVFNSDTEFISLFHKFVVSLLKDEKENDQNSMIFLFIDDIDLSTIRCTDVVKTLLSYLSNPRIVTFISGDMDTFEEALTLDFLRQEEALHADVFQWTYYAVIKERDRSDTEGKNGNKQDNSDAEGQDKNKQDKNNLLERKKTLAYDYLKKIIPPAYRRSIKYWSLEERGRYQIMESEESRQKTLAQLLVEVTKGKVDQTYFIYQEEGSEREQEEGGKAGKTEGKPDDAYMGPAFHMFDDTSRGLNNVYIVLQELHDLQAQGAEISESRKMLSYWKLIETMVDSKSLYAKYKEQLLKKIIVLEQEQVKVNFANAHRLLLNTGNNSSEERFAMFFLVDFAARLFSGEQNDNSDYMQLRRWTIQEYLSDETLDDRIAPRRDLILWQTEEKNRSKIYNDIQSILIDFLEKGDFIFSLYLIRYLGRDEIYHLLGNDKSKWPSEKESAYKIAYALVKTVWAMNETEESRREYLAGLYVQMQDTMLELLDKLSLDRWMIYGRQLTDGVAINAGGMQYMEYKPDPIEMSYWNIENYIHESSINIPQTRTLNVLWAAYESRNFIYWIYYEKVVREKDKHGICFDIEKRAINSVSAGLTKTIMNQMQEVMEQYQVKELPMMSESDLPKETEEKKKRERQQKLAISLIDQKKQWQTRYVKEKVFPYLERERSGLLGKMSSGRVIFDATEMIPGAYAALKNCEKGSSGKAIVYGLLSRVQKILFLHISGGQYEDRMFEDGRYYLRLEQSLVVQCLLEEFLINHGGARYGKKEIRRLLMEIRELPLVLHTPGWHTINRELEKREDAFFREDRRIAEQLKDRATKELEKKESLENIVERICREVYHPKNKERKSVNELLNEFLGEVTEEDSMYFRHLVQERQIQKLLEEYGMAAEPEEKWKAIEPVISKEEYQFIFHSYLRYLQANDSDAKKAGVQAEYIAKLAEYMLDSEVIADRQIQNEVYEIISGEMELTEEEFEQLF